MGKNGWLLGAADRHYLQPRPLTERLETRRLLAAAVEPAPWLTDSAVLVQADEHHASIIGPSSAANGAVRAGLASPSRKTPLVGIREHLPVGVAPATSDAGEVVGASISQASSGISLETGYHVPGAAAPVTSGAGDNDGFEIGTVHDVQSNDGSYMVSVNSGTNTSSAASLPNTVSDQHDFSEFDLNIPAHAFVEGITVTLTAKYDSNAGSNSYAVFLSPDGGLTWSRGRNSGDIGSGNSTAIIGNPADTWGNIWTSEDLNNNFRVRIMTLAGNLARDASLDYLAVNVFYTLDLAPGVDLVVGNVNFTPTATPLGGPAEISFRVGNFGTDAAPPTQARLRLSTDRTLTLDDKPLDPLDVNIPSIPAGRIYEYTGPFTVPESTGAGSYYVGVFADVWNSAGQTDVTNDSALSGMTLTVTDPPLRFELLARGVAYESNFVRDNPVNYPGLSPGYYFDELFADGPGFHALGLRSTTFGPALVIRGTQEPMDFWDDVNPAGVGHKQFLRNWPRISAWLYRQDAVDITGHSLGGALAQWIASAATSAGLTIDRLITFNSPGIRSTEAATFNPLLSNGVSHYVVNGDVVSMAGQAFVTGTVGMASFSDPWMWDFDKHRLPLTVPAVGGRQRPTDLSWQHLATADALNAPSYVHSDLDYRLWVTGMTFGALSIPGAAGLALVPAALLRRDTTEAVRATVGAAGGAVSELFDTTVDLTKWSLKAANQFRLTLQERAHDLYEALRPTVGTTFTLSGDGGNPAALVFNGALAFDIGSNLSINLPSWLGGTITADHLLRLAELDVNGSINRNAMSASGDFSVLGGMLSVGGTASMDFQRDELALTGAINILGDFITGTDTLRVTDRLGLALGGSADINYPSAVPWIGGKSIAGGDFLLNYSHDGNLSNDFVAAWGNIGPVRLGLRVRFDGVWDIIGGKEIAAIQGLQFGSAAESTSGAFPVGALTEWLLLTAEWEHDSATTEVRVTTPSGQTLTEADVLGDPSMEIVAELTTPRRKVVRVLSPEAGDWRIGLSDATGLGMVNYSALVEVPPVTAAFTSITGGERREAVVVALSISGGTNVKAALYYDGDASGQGGVLIADDLEPTAAGLVEHSWDPAGAPVGDHFIYAVISDSTAVPVTVYSTTPVTITDVRPDVSAAKLDPVAGSNVGVVFTQDVQASFDASDVILTNLVTGSSLPAGQLVVKYDEYTNTGFVRPASGGVLPDGWYRLMLLQQGIVNPSGEHLAREFAFDFIFVGSDGTYSLPAGADVISVNDLAVIGSGRLDIGASSLVIDYTGESPLGASTGSGYTGIAGLVASGHDGGSWDGPGIVSSAAAGTGGLTGLGLAEAAEMFGLIAGQTALWDGQTVDATSVIIKYTYAGDANLDGFISGDDYSSIDFNVQVAGASGWYNGDFNYDGIISGDDYSVIDFNILAQGPPLSGAGNAKASRVPGAIRTHSTFGPSLRDDAAGLDEDEELLASAGDSREIVS